MNRQRGREDLRATYVGGYRSGGMHYSDPSSVEGGTGISSFTPEGATNIAGLTMNRGMGNVNYRGTNRMMGNANAMSLPQRNTGMFADTMENSSIGSHSRKTDNRSIQSDHMMNSYSGGMAGSNEGDIYHRAYSGGLPSGLGNLNEAASGVGNSERAFDSMNSSQGFGYTENRGERSNRDSRGIRSYSSTDPFYTQTYPRGNEDELHQQLEVQRKLKAAAERIENEIQQGNQNVARHDLFSADPISGNVFQKQANALDEVQKANAMEEARIVNAVKSQIAQASQNVLLEDKIAKVFSNMMGRNVPQATNMNPMLSPPMNAPVNCFGDSQRRNQDCAPYRTYRDQRWSPDRSVDSRRDRYEAPRNRGETRRNPAPYRSPEFQKRKQLASIKRQSQYPTRQTKPNAQQRKRIAAAKKTSNRNTVVSRVVAAAKSLVKAKTAIQLNKLQKDAKSSVGELKKKKYNRELSCLVCNEPHARKAEFLKHMKQHTGEAAVMRVARYEKYCKICCEKYRERHYALHAMLSLKHKAAAEIPRRAIPIPDEPVIEPEGVDYILPVNGFLCKICHIFYYKEKGMHKEHCTCMKHRIQLMEHMFANFSKEETKDFIKELCKEQGVVYDDEHIEMILSNDLPAHAPGLKQSTFKKTRRGFRKGFPKKGPNKAPNKAPYKGQKKIPGRFQKYRTGN